MPKSKGTKAPGTVNGHGKNKGEKSRGGKSLLGSLGGSLDHEKLLQQADEAFDEALDDALDVGKIAGKLVLDLDSNLHPRPAEFVIVMNNGCKPTKIMKALRDHGLICEEWVHADTRVKGTDATTTYIFVDATDARIDEARLTYERLEALQTGRALPHSQKRRPSAATTDKESATQLNTGMFSNADRLMYLSYILETEVHLQSNEDLADLIDEVVPLHDDAENQAFLTRSHWKNFQKNLTATRNHFGDQIGWYYAWISHYTVWLIFPALFGIIVELIRAYCSKEAYAKSQLAFSVLVLIWINLMLRFWERRQTYLKFLWNISPDFVDIHELSGWKMNSYKRLNTVTMRVERYIPFYIQLSKRLLIVPIILIFMLLVLLIAVGCFLFQWYIKFYDCSPPNDQYWYCAYDPKDPTSAYGINIGFLTFLAAALPDIIFAIVVDVLVKEIFHCLIVKVADFESWQFHSQWESSYVTKMYGIYFLGLFGYFWSLAFLYVPAGHAFREYVPLMSNINVDPMAEWVHVNCPDVPTLQVNSTWTVITNSTTAQRAYSVCTQGFRRDKFVSIITAYVTITQFINIIVKSLLPFVLRRFLCKPICFFCDRYVCPMCKSAPEDAQESQMLPLAVTPDHIELAMAGIDKDARVDKVCEGADKQFSCKEKTKTKIADEVDKSIFDTFGDYAESACQLTFIAMFCSVYPLMPLLILANNLIEINTDKFKMVYQEARIIPRRTPGLGAWLSIFTFIARASIVVNLATVLISLEIGPLILPSTLLKSDVVESDGRIGQAIMLLGALIIERLVDFACQFIDMVVPAEPKIVRDSRKLAEAKLYAERNRLLEKAARGDMSVVTGELRIKIHRAAQLINQELLGTSDPYVQIQLQHSTSQMKYRTFTKFDTLNPQWDENVIFDIDNMDDVLQVSVFDDDSMSGAMSELTDGFMGYVNIPLSSLPANGVEVTNWYDLKSARSASISSPMAQTEKYGRIYITLSLVREN